MRMPFNLSQLRQLGEKKREAILDSVEPVKILLSDIFHRLELHGKKVPIVFS